MNETKSLPLTELLDRYIAAKNEDRPIGCELSPQTRRAYLLAIQSYAALLGRAPTIEDLSPERITDFLAAKLANAISPYTVKNYRTHLRVLMRFAKREGLSTHDPDRVRRVHCPRLQVRGYSVTDMQQLLTAVSKLVGVVRGTGISKRIYFSSMILTMWDIGCRIGDIPRIEASKFDPAVGRLWVFETKTRKSRWHRLYSITVEAIRACLVEDPERRLIWPGYQPRCFYRVFGYIADKAGVGGTSRFIRRGASSELDRLHPGQGWRFLNHSCPQVFENHYRDADICGDESLSPPELPIDARIAALYVPAKPPRASRANREKAPTPQKPAYSRPSEVALTEEVREALGHHPMTDANLAVLVGHLTAHGITQRQLAEWWGVAFKRYQDFRYGYRMITLTAADRLRRTFDIEPQGMIADHLVGLGSLRATPEIAGLLAGQMGASELRAVCDYVKQSLGIPKWRLAASMGINGNYLLQMCSGRVPCTVQQKLCELFAIEQSEVAQPPTYRGAP
jgi:integrase